MSRVRDVAQVAGVSVATVYKVFNEDYTTSEDVRNRVIAAAKTLSYTHKASSEKTQKTAAKNTVGIVVGSILNPFFNRMIEAISKEFERYHYRVLILYCNDDVHQFNSNLELLMQLNVKAVIFEPMTDTRYDIVYRLKENGIVMLQLFSSVYPELDTLQFDDELGTYTAVKHFLKSGHSRIAMIYKYWAIRPEREPGYLRAFQEFNIDVNPEFLCKLSFEGSIKNIIKERIEKLKPTAILAVNEPISINVVQALGELNLKIPEDISLIIYDDLSWATAYNISTIAHAFDSVGSQVCQVIMRRIKLAGTGQEIEPIRLVIDPELISRGSVSFHTPISTE